VDPYWILTDTDYLTIKYNSDGIEEWVVRYSGPGYTWNASSAIAVDDHENIYVTGGEEGTGTDYDYATVKYNAAGYEQWVAVYNGPGNGKDSACDIAIDDNGNVYVTGKSDPGTNYNYDYATVKYSPDGVEQWVARYDGGGSGYDNAQDIALDQDGFVYVTGISASPGLDNDYATIKYNSDGVEQWVARYDGGWYFNDGAHSLAIDRRGIVYVTGASSGGGINQWDYVTIKYNSEGIQQWIMRYDSPENGDDTGKCLALDDEDNVYVAGYVGIAHTYDIVLIKYSQFQPDLVLQLTPYSTPIQIPASGGSFDYNINVLNNSPGEVTADIWGVVTLPSGSQYRPVLGPFDLTLAAGDSSNRNQMQSVPGRAQSGTYTYTVYAGIYPREIWAEDTFSFEKLPTGSGIVIDDWANTSAPSRERFNQSKFPVRSNFVTLSPNPFNLSTAISYQLSAVSFVNLAVYDVGGRKVAELVNDWRDAGVHEVVFDGSGLASGVYVYQLQTGLGSTMGKLLLVK
jgi:uncharacterized delta-60 repeat protein